MLSPRPRLLGLFVAAIGLAVGAIPSAAQTPAKPAAELPPLEVVATRRPEATHDVPASIEVISGADLRARGVTNLREALSLAAGVAIAPGGDGGPASSVPEFWGLREFDAFLLVVDGIPWGGALNPALSTLDLHDVERIEILRGPAPVTYGATSFVGVIQVVHNAAAATARNLAAYGGAFGTGGLAADLPVSTGAWKSRVNGDFDRQGFKDDRTSYKRGHAAFRITKPGVDRNAWFTADVTLLRQDPASPHPLDGNTLSTAVPLDANHNPGDAFLNENRFVASAGFQRPVFHGATWGSMAAFTHSTNNIFRGFLTDISNTPDNAAGFKENIDINDIYADTHIIWAGQSKLRFLTGADLLFGGGEAHGATFTYTAPLDGATAPNVPEPTTLDKDSEDHRLFLGAYGSAEWQPVSRVTFSAGLRFNSTSEKRDEDSPSSNHTRLSGSAGVLVGLVENGVNHLRAFVNYRNTFKPAAFDFGLVENEGILDPETSSSFEGGLKARTMDGRVDFEASYFHMDFTNLVTAAVINNQPALINSGKTRFQGFELAADLRLAHAVFARGTYSYHDGKFLDFVADLDGTLTQLAGHRVEMSAHHLASAGLTLSPDLGFIASGSFNYTGSRYLNVENDALAAGFLTFDVGVGYRFRRFEVRVDGRNLGNRRDALSESEFGDAQYYRMPARSVQASVRLSY